MKIKSSPNKFFLPLLAATIIVWGTVIYNVVEVLLFAPEEEVILIEDESFPSLETGNSESTLNTVKDYLNIERDPFTLPRKKVSTKKAVQVKEKPIKRVQFKKSIEIAVNGVILNNGNKLVIVEDLTNNKTVFLKEKEEYEGILVKTIMDTLVTIERDSNETRYKLK